ncbi:hypothetical protein [Desulfocurvus sp. DL9XJH121]
MNRDQTGERLYSIENVAFGARSTELAWTFLRPYDEVWDAVNSAAILLGLTVVSADRRVGLSVAKPPFSLLNVGRRVAFTFARSGGDRTLVRATLLHGIMSLQSRRARQQSLDVVFRAALAELNRSAPSAEPAPPAPPKPREEARREAQPSPRPMPDAQGGAPGDSGPHAPAGDEPAPDLRAMDFSRADWDSLPLTPPRGADSSQFRHLPPGREPLRLGRTIGWFLLGTGIALAAYALGGGLSFLWR